MLGKTGQVKLIDFGTAWVRGQEKNRIQGTPQFLAPEQATEKTVNEKTDIYNLGATMYRMFTGRYPQQGILKPGEDRKLVPPNKINVRILSALNELILSSLSIDPSKRPVGMFEIRDQLSADRQADGPDGGRPPRGRRGRLTHAPIGRPARVPGHRPMDARNPRLRPARLSIASASDHAWYGEPQ